MFLLVIAVCCSLSLFSLGTMASHRERVHEEVIARNCCFWFVSTIWQLGSMGYLAPIQNGLVKFFFSTAAGNVFMNKMSSRWNRIKPWEHSQHMPTFAKILSVVFA